MKRCILVHRWSGGANDDWRPWLKRELEALGVEVHNPEMPDAEEPVIEKWVGKLRELVPAPDAETYFVGHSIGNQAILRYLETAAAPVGGAVFVAGWFDLENLKDEETREVARPWIETPIDFERVKRILPRSTLIISDNDPYGAYDANVAGFSRLGTKTAMVHGAGHFTEGGGFTELPEALRELKLIAGL
jgi:predicted alpha/beta hydrolase family esterase